MVCPVEIGDNRGMRTDSPEDARGEYGPPAAEYRRYARAYNLARLQHRHPEDLPFTAITLSTVNGVPVPAAWQLNDAAYAAQWWGLHMPPGIFYAALFNNDWFPRYPPKLVREYLHGGKWLGPIPP
jgi:hypothetical protein